MAHVATVGTVERRGGEIARARICIPTERERRQARGDSLRSKKQLLRLCWCTWVGA
jgi:hypothetical protein